MSWIFDGALKSPSQIMISIVKTAENVFPNSMNGSKHPSAILVVDDSQDACVMIKSMLKSVCSDVEYVLSGNEAIKTLETNSYDLVIMDLEMPETDGFDVVKELRRQGVKRPIIALSGHDDQESRSRAMESGFNGFLAKPIHRADLCATVLTAYTESL